MNREEEDIRLLKEYAKEDFIFHREEVYDWRAFTSVEDAKQVYEEGVQEAREEEKQKGFVRMRLEHLLWMMNQGSEWYGIAFDDPKTLVQEVLDHLNKGK